MTIKPNTAEGKSAVRQSGAIGANNPYSITFPSRFFLRIFFGVLMLVEVCESNATFYAIVFGAAGNVG